MKNKANISNTIHLDCTSPWGSEKENRQGYQSCFFLWLRNLKCSCENEKQTSGVDNDVRNTELNDTVKGAD